jgi:hypothetical protein
VIVGPGRPYPEADVRAAMRDAAPATGCIAWDPAAAAVISDGFPAPRKWAISPLLRSAAALASALVAGAAELPRPADSSAVSIPGRPGPPSAADSPVAVVQVEAPVSVPAASGVSAVRTR